MLDENKNAKQMAMQKLEFFHALEDATRVQDTERKVRTMFANPICILIYLGVGLSFWAITRDLAYYFPAYRDVPAPFIVAAATFLAALPPLVWVKILNIRTRELYYDLVKSAVNVDIELKNEAIKYLELNSESIDRWAEIYTGITLSKAVSQEKKEDVEIPDESVFIHEANDVQEAIDIVKGIKKGKIRMWEYFPAIISTGNQDVKAASITFNDSVKMYILNAEWMKEFKELCEAILSLESLDSVFDYPEQRILQSSMTIFANMAPLAIPERNVYREILDKFFEGEEDADTAEVIAESREK